MWLANSNRALGSARTSVRFVAWLLVPLYLLGVLALYTAFIYAPTERVMGEVQRIFYFHVGAAWTAFLAFFFVFLGGVIYLMRRNVFWDYLAAASAEVGVIFTTIVLVTGPIWARPVWNTWWPWGDPRVTTTLVLWLIYVAYLILRNSLGEGEKRARFSAVFGIIGFIDVPIVWLSIRWWRTIHPVVITKTGASLEPEMVQALIVSVATFTVFYIALMCLRLAMHLHNSAAEEMAQAVRERSE
ncbi:MAG: cytochrome C assembly protein [Acidobacteria bacterium]|nr:MAG: cytochrome C assembly protein [Acidobacteriota bacterium]